MSDKGSDTMFVIIGTKLQAEEIGNLPQAQICPRCHREIYFQAVEEQKMFTTYWMPVFPIESKYYFRCPSCGLEYRMSKHQMTELLSGKKALDERCVNPEEKSLLEKAAFQAGRLSGRLQRFLED